MNEEINYQGKRFVQVRDMINDGQVISTLEESLQNGDILIIDPKGALFNFKGKEPNFRKYAVYRWDGTFPRFITYVDQFIGSEAGILGFKISFKIS